MAKKDSNAIATNRKARHDFFIEETYEAGLVLQGTEIKSIRAGRVNLKDAFARVSNGEVYVHNMHISTYEQGNRYNHEPTRSRKLLLHRSEINKLIGQTQMKGYSLVPLKIYIKNGVAKLLIGLGKGKKKYDKREDLKQKAAKRDVERAMKEHFQEASLCKQHLFISVEICYNTNCKTKHSSQNVSLFTGTFWIRQG